MRAPALALLVLLPGLAVAAERPLTRTVRISVRVEGDGRDVRLELPLVQTTPHQNVLSEKLDTLGLPVEEVRRDGNRLAVISLPSLTGARRISYEFTITTLHTQLPVPGRPSPAPSAEDAPWLRPTRHLQTGSPILREKLRAFAGPRVEAGDLDAVRTAWELTATGYEQSAAGSSSVLTATRTGLATSRGLDRLLATFLRGSGVPARPVGGLDLARGLHKRHAHWVEARPGDRWVPLSVPLGLYGELPARLVELVHGDRPLLVHDGARKVAFRVRVDEPGIKR